MASSDFWRDLAVKFSMIRHGWSMMAMLNLKPDKDGLQWEIAATPEGLDEFRVLAMRGAKEVAHPWEIDLLAVWLNLLRERGFGFKPGQPVLGVKPDGSDPQHYLTGTIHELPKESARLCKMLEAKTVQEEFAKGKIDSSPGTPLKAVEPPITSPARRTKNVDLSRYLDGAKLTEKQYKCASLKWEYGLSVSQIAKELAIHRKTVGEHIQSAQNKMNRSGQYEAVKKHLARFNLDD